MRHAPSRHLIHPKQAAILAQRAQVMRRELTPSEAALWRELSGKKLGVGFRRQVVVGRYIADFAAPAVKLIVEVDGGYHRERVAADARRDRALQRAGWRVVRVTVEELRQNVSQVVERVRGVVG